MMSADNPPRAMLAKARELGELNRKPLPCQPIIQTVRGDALLAVRIDHELLESLEARSTYRDPLTLEGEESAHVRQPRETS